MNPIVRYESATRATRSVVSVVSPEIDSSLMPSWASNWPAMNGKPPSELPAGDGSEVAAPIAAPVAVKLNTSRRSMSPEMLPYAGLFGCVGVTSIEMVSPGSNTSKAARSQGELYSVVQNADGTPMLLRLKFAPCTSTVMVASSCIEREDAIDTGDTFSGRPFPGKLGIMFVRSGDAPVPSAPERPCTPIGFATGMTVGPALSITAPKYGVWYMLGCAHTPMASLTSAAE